SARPSSSPALPLQTGSGADRADGRVISSAPARQRPVGRRRCFHDDAVIESVASSSRPLGADETAIALGEGVRDGVYMGHGWQYEELEPDVVLSITRASTGPAGQFATRPCTASSAAGMG